MITEIVSVVPTVMITGQGIWSAYMSVEPEDNKKTQEGTQGQIKGDKGKKDVVLVFPCYKDVVEIDKWLAWSKDVKKLIIVEDVYNGNKSKDPRVIRTEEREQKRLQGRCVLTLR